MTPHLLHLPPGVKRLAFISDLHLDPSLPRTVAGFVRFLETLPQQADALLILGDLFEYWAGDDDIGRGINLIIVQALRQARHQQLLIYLQHGNRDFLLGENFAEISGVKLLPDAAILNIANEPVLLLHGDTLCTDDSAYQEFRAQVRAAPWQRHFLAQPLPQRLQQIETLRQGSKQATANKPSNIMDVNADAVQKALHAAGCHKLIHGHTHRPATHRGSVNGHTYERWVLSDWDLDHTPARGNALLINEHGWQWQTIPPAD